MSRVEIEYCVPCGFRNRAFEVAEAILGAVETDLDDLTLRMGDHGIFTVAVDGRVIYDKDEHDYDVDAVVRRVRDEL
ncbi:MAG: Rdx family protein [Haloarculaceae archaeon]